MLGGIIASQGLMMASGGGGGGTWDLSNLAVPPAIWLNDISSVTGTTNASQWNDISGNGYHYSQGTGSLQPAILASGLDGKRTISGDGGDLMSNSSAGAKALTQDQTAAWLAVVLKNNDSSATTRDVFYVSTNSSSAARFAVATSTTSGLRRPALRVRRQDSDPAALVLNASAALDTNAHVLLFTMDWANGDGTIYIDGVQDAQNLALTSSGNTSNTASLASLALYGSSVGASTSDIAEIAFGVGALPTSDERDKIFGRLHHKWGLEALLDALHPYKAAPP